MRRSHVPLSLLGHYFPNESSLEGGAKRSFVKNYRELTTI